MTGPEMNVSRAKKIAIAALAAAAAPVGLGGCASAFAPRTDDQSSLAPAIEQMVAANRRYPRWEDFPAAPTDLPSNEAVASRVASLQTASTALARDTAAIAWTLDDPAGFAQSVRSRIESSRPSSSTIQTEADVEAFAQRLRDRAAAPPPVDRFRRPPG